jgi:hypothetical protein
MPYDSIRSACTVHIEAGALRAEVQRALTSIEAVHGITGSPTPVPIRPFSAPPELAGGYRRFRDGTPIDILVNRAATDVSFTVLHELGHYLDDQAIEPAGEFASGAGHVPEWSAVVEASDAVLRLRELERQAPVTFEVTSGFAVILDADDFAYMLEPEELFARSYAQYIASRSGDPVTLSELHAGQEVVYPEQWSDADFESIAAEFDELLERLGWSGS